MPSTAYRRVWAARKRERGLFTIYNFGVSRFRPQRLPEPDAAASPAPEVQTWRFPDALERYDDRMNQRTKSFVAHELIHAGYRGLDPAEFGLSEGTIDATMASEKEATEKIGVLAQLIEPYERVCAARVAHGLEAACRLAAIDDASEALVAVETLHGRLMLEVCWLALKGEVAGRV